MTTDCDPIICFTVPGAPGLAPFETWVATISPHAATQNRAALFEEEVPAPDWQQ